MYRKEKNKDDVIYILEHLKPEDEHEARTIKGENFKELILEEIMNDKTITFLGCRKSDDLPVCIGGYTDTNEKGIGCVWLLSTPEIVKKRTSLIRNIFKAFQEIDEKYWFTYNLLFSENHFAKSWLKKIGFKFDCPHPQGMNIPEGFEFFYRMRKTRGLGDN